MDKCNHETPDANKNIRDAREALSNYFKKADRGHPQPSSESEISGGNPYLRKSNLPLLVDSDRSDCGSTTGLSIYVSTKSKYDACVAYRSIIKEDGSLELALPEDYKKWIGKTVQIRSPLYCKNDRICSVCAGRLPYMHPLVTHKQPKTFDYTKFYKDPDVWKTFARVLETVIMTCSYTNPDTNMTFVNVSSKRLCIDDAYIPNGHIDNGDIWTRIGETPGSLIVTTSKHYIPANTCIAARANTPEEDTFLRKIVRIITNLFSPPLVLFVDDPEAAKRYSFFTNVTELTASFQMHVIGSDEFHQIELMTMDHSTTVLEYQDGHSFFIVPRTNKPGMTEWASLLLQYNDRPDDAKSEYPIFIPVEINELKNMMRGYYHMEGGVPRIVQCAYLYGEAQSVDKITNAFMQLLRDEDIPFVIADIPKDHIEKESDLCEECELVFNRWVDRMDLIFLRIESPIQVFPIFGTYDKDPVDLSMVVIGSTRFEFEKLLYKLENYELLTRVSKYV